MDRYDGSSIHSLDGALAASKTWHPDDSVARIQAPVLVVRGDEDHLTALADAAELRHKLPHAHLLNIPFAGHVAYAEGKDIFLPALRRFLSEPHD